MAHVAAEMEREGFDIPLLIGGATTSRVHTAVKIHPRYERGQAIHVNDASRAVGVVSSLLSPDDARPRRSRRCAPNTARSPTAHERSEAEKTRTPLAKARANAMAIDWSAYRPTTPTFLGTRTFASNDLVELARYIDWTPFFQTWELKGRYPAILDDPKQGAAARTLFDDAQGDAEADHRGDDGSSRKPWSASGPRRGTATTSRSSRRGAHGADRHPPHLAPAARPPRRPAQSRARRLRRPDGGARLYRRLRRHRGRRGRGGRAALRARQRRLFGDPRQSARRPAGRGLRRGDARQGAARTLGLRPRRRASPPKS